LYGQVTFTVTSVPEDTPLQSELYITGNFNDWQAALPEYALRKDREGNWSITLNDLPDTVRYKFTRGTFASVEGNAYGLMRDERMLVVPSRPIAVPVAIESWEDTPSKQQYRVYVDQVPSNTPADDQLYIVGNFNNWNPGETRYQFRKLRDGRYYIQLPFLLDTLRCKITRGTWETVEANAAGDLRGDRVYLLVDHPTREVHISVEGWEDQEPLTAIHVTVTNIPENTPHDARLYVAGNFNGWTSDNPRHELIRQENGHYTVRLYSPSDTLYYKITRGNFSSVEGRANGLVRGNRVYVLPPGQKDHYLNIEVEAWEDLATRWFNLYTLMLLLPVGLGVLLILGFIFGRPERGWGGPSVVPVLSVLVVSLLFRVLYYYRDIFNVYPWIILWGDIIYFVFPPLVYSYMYRLVNPNKTGRVLPLWVWVPGLVHLLFMLGWHLMPKEEFLVRMVNQTDHGLFGLISWLGCGFGVWLWWRGIGLMRDYRVLMANKLARPVAGQYLPALLAVMGGVYAIWIAVNLLGVIEYSLGVPLAQWIELGTNAAWWLVSAPIYVIGYHALHAPQIPDASPAPEPEREVRPVGEDLKQAAAQLRTVMDGHKLYLNPGLSLSQLAEKADLSEGLLSRVINDEIGQNFYDFVNDYRVRAFIQRVQEGEDQHLTFLALALTVGFSSKSTFNRAFKKLTEVTPREFFRLSVDEQVRRLGERTIANP